MKNYVAELIDILSEQLPSLPPELIDLYALLAFVKGTDTTLEDVHDAWSVWKNRGNPNHRSLVWFDELSPEVQELDRDYMNAIHRAVVTFVQK